jgi:hypothetical protein
LKRLIEGDIYPTIVDIFDTGSERVFTGPRDHKGEIKLRMTDRESVAMWDESSNFMTIPYRRLYVQMGNYDSETMQLNAIAHELTHYHFNGFALREGGDYRRVPLWFREGISEYGAHAFYVRRNGAGSVSQFRQQRLILYLTNPDLHFKETVGDSALDKVSWLSDGDIDRNIPGYDHIYYGAAYSFIDYYLRRRAAGEDDNRMDLLKHAFIEGGRGDFKFYKQVGGKADTITAEKMRESWFNYLDRTRNIKKDLNNKPTLTKKVKDTLNGVASFLKNLAGF